jgi:hypothetical protein
MSAKDKAIEIVTKYAELDFGSNDKIVISVMHKKQALIAVDEILKQCWDYRDIDLQASYDYWKEVKKEIELL